MVLLEWMSSLADSSPSVALSALSYTQISLRISRLLQVISGSYLSDMIEQFELIQSTVSLIFHKFGVKWDAIHHGFSKFQFLLIFKRKKMTQKAFKLL